MADFGDWVNLDPEEMSIERCRQILDDLTKIVDTPGKKYLDKLLTLRYHGIMAELVSSPVTTIDGTLAQEYDKGRAIECLYQQGLCEGLIANFRDALERLQAQQQAEDEFDDN